MSTKFGTSERCKVYSLIRTYYILLTYYYSFYYSQHRTSDTVPLHFGNSKYQSGKFFESETYLDAYTVFQKKKHRLILLAIS